MAVPEGRWIRITDIARADDLDTDAKIALVAMAIEELGVAYSLTMTHGPEAGMEQYKAMGGHVRIDPQGSAVIWSVQ